MFPSISEVSTPPFLTMTEFCSGGSRIDCDKDFGQSDLCNWGEQEQNQYNKLYKNLKGYAFKIVYFEMWY